jgi:CDGSH-type Zn-finger protein
MKWFSASDKITTAKEYMVVIVKNGPYLVKGGLPVNRVRVTFDAEDNPLAYEIVETYPAKPVQSLCRCGKSKTRPFCDGAHTRIFFPGKEEASRTPYHETAKKLIGRNLILLDATELCMGIGFCHRAGSTWVLTRYSDNPDKRRLAIEEAGLCPSGRLVACDKETEQPLEPDFEPSISVIDDDRVSANYPIWLKAGIPVQSQNGFFYEIRYRVTLCSCGHSKNKPFCDGRHYFADSFAG